MPAEAVTLVSLLAMLVIPTTIFMITGRFDDGAGHMIVFMVLGFALFFPTAVAGAGINFALIEAGFDIPPATDCGKVISANTDGDCALTVSGASIWWFGLGIAVYIVTYFAGVNIHELVYE